MKEIRKRYMESENAVYTGSFFNGDVYVAWDGGNKKLHSICFKTSEEIERVAKILKQLHADLKKAGR